MPKIIRKEQFDKAISDLWNKIRTNFISNITFDTQNGTNGKPKNTLKFTKNRNENNSIIEHVVTKWNDLENTTEYKYINLASSNHYRDGKRLEHKNAGELGTLKNYDGWASYVDIPVEEGQQLTMLKSHDDWWGMLFYYNENGEFIKIDGEERGMTRTNNWYRKQFEIPAGQGVSKIGFVIRHYNDPNRKIMLLKGYVDEDTPYIPYIDGAKIQIGTELSYKFDNTLSNLNSTSLGSAITELANRKPNIDWPDLEGVKRYEHGNLLEITRVKKTGYYRQGDKTPQPSQEWGTVYVKLEPNKTYTMLRKDDGVYSRHMAFRRDDGEIGTVDVHSNNTKPSHVGNNGTYHYKVFTNGDVNGTLSQYVGVEIHVKHNSNSLNDFSCMLIEGDARNYRGDTIPFGKSVQIGSNVSRLFSPHNADCGLISYTIESALEEIGYKIKNVDRHRVGEMMTLFYKPNLGGDNEFIVDGVTYIWCGQNGKQVSATKYPDLAKVLNKQTTGSFLVPHVADINHSGSQSNRYHFICAKTQALTTAVF